MVGDIFFRLLKPVCATTVLMMVTSTTAIAEEALLAVAANFAEATQQLAAEFDRQSGHDLTIVTGSTGQLYAQIVNGAPFDVFLSADQATPEKLVSEGGAVAGSRFTYAIGRIALWSADPDLVPQDGPRYLEDGEFRALAMANPALAPYGAAARETLKGLDLWDDLRDRIVMGENIGQTHAMVATGNAEAGFVALSHVLSPRTEQPGSRWDVPQNLYAPIRQDAVLLTRGAENPAARGFLEFLKSKEAGTIVESYGYGVD